MTRLLSIIHLMAFLSCCVIAVALTDIHGHVNIGHVTISYNETPVEYAELAMTASRLGDMK